MGPTGSWCVTIHVALRKAYLGLTYVLVHANAVDILARRSWLWLTTESKRDWEIEDRFCNLPMMQRMVFLWSLIP